MGAVYKVRQKSLDRIVALKIFLVRDEHPQFEERFLREARTLARLSHPNIVTVFDFGQRDDCHFLLMEYVDGLNLRQVSQGTRLSAQHALQLVPQLCDALQFAHDNGVVHRDIKPENVLMDQQGNLKIADFGLAKLTGNNVGTALTQTQQVMGTINYMAPEQREKPTEVDHRADIYSLGVVIYELLTGELPLGRFQPPSKKVHVDVRLDEVVLRALEKEPELRYQNASEFKTGIQNVSRLTDPAVAPVQPVKPQVHKDQLVDAEVVSPYTRNELKMRIYQMFATMICISCALVFVLGTDQAGVLDEDLSQTAGIMVALAGGFLFAISGYVRRLIGARPSEPDDQKEYDQTSWQGAMTRIVAMAFGFGCAISFILRSQLDRNEREFFIAGIACGIVCAMIFTFSNFVDEVAGTRKPEK